MSVPDWCLIICDRPEWWNDRVSLLFWGVNLVNVVIHLLDSIVVLSWLQVDCAQRVGWTKPSFFPSIRIAF